MGTRECEELGLQVHYGNNKVDCSDLASPNLTKEKKYLMGLGASRGVRRIWGAFFSLSFYSSIYPMLLVIRQSAQGIGFRDRGDHEISGQPWIT